MKTMTYDLATEVPLRPGDRVCVTVYGAEETGIVERVGSSVVWVRMDRTGPRPRPLRWFHRESLRPDVS